jgi:hypothetical protein
MLPAEWEVKSVNPFNTDISPSVPGLSPEVRVRRQEGVVLRHVVGEHVLVPAMTRKVDLDSLFLLNAAGVFIWEHLDGRRRVRDFGEMLAKSFATESEAAVANVAHFLSSLLAQNLAVPAED